MKLKNLLFSLSLILSVLNTAGQTPVIKNGILDLRFDGISDKVSDLNGDWEFYWGKLLSPGDFEKNSDLKPDIYGKVPAYWTEYSDDIPDISPAGFATYRLRIIISPSDNQELSFIVPVFDSSYRIYFNGKYINANGVPGSTPETTKAGYKPYTYHMIPDKDTIEIVVNVSNFHHRRGGFWLPMKFGKRDIADLEIKRISIIETLSNGMLLAFVGFFLLFYSVFRNDRTMLYFALASLGVLLRTLFTGNYDILYFFDISWQWLIRIEYLGSFLAIVFAMWYFYYIYKDKIIPWINTAITVLFSVASLLTLTTPVSVFSYTMLIFMPVVVLVLGYYMIRSVVAAINEGGYKTLIAIGFGALLLGVMNDIYVSIGRKLITSEYILSYSLILFILIQVIIIIYRWYESTQKEKKLIDEIEFVNKNLENIVIERTSELTNQKGELEEQKKVTDLKNLELEKTIATKNRIFSIIAHDLKSPVLNLSMMIEHLKNNDDPEVQKSVINSISQQAVFAGNLIENLLIWGEQQYNSIEYKPEQINLTDLVLENFNLLNETAQRKKIKMTYSHRGNPTAICDKDLINIVIRNLLSNAVKFTKRSGAIYVSIEEPSIKDGMIYIKIKDNGIGISGEKLEKIQSDEIVESSRGTDDEKGTGLGLQLCKDLININKGSISFESELNRGTTITIMLPSPTSRS
jgi:signal transduction histidine kinase